MGRSSHETDRLWEEALDLIVRLQNDPRNPVTLEIIRGWRRRSAAHEAAWSEASEIYGLSGQVLSARAKAERRRESRVSRRAVLVGGAATAAAGVAALTAPAILLHARADYITGAGEIRRIDLPDGSVATLGPDSAIRLGFTPDGRDVDLLAGMSFFDVAPDAKRPFRVTTGGLTATALGTAFEVRSDAGYLTVAVDHGLVGIDIAGAAAPMDAPLGASEWLTFDESAASVERGKKDPTQIAAWRENLIFADRESISSLVARISRWRQGRVIILDPWFGRERVSGVYDLTKPMTALQAVVTPYGGTVRSLSPYLAVISRI